MLVGKQFVPCTFFIANADFQENYILFINPELFDKVNQLFDNIHA